MPLLVHSGMYFIPINDLLYCCSQTPHWCKFNTMKISNLRQIRNYLAV